MNNLFSNLFGRKNSNKNDEGKLKEEEDVIKDIKLNFDVVSNKKTGDLDSLVNGIKINGFEIKK